MAMRGGTPGDAQLPEPKAAEATALAPAGASAPSTRGGSNPKGIPPSPMTSPTPVSAPESEILAEESEFFLAALREADAFTAAARASVDEWDRLRRLHELRRTRRAIEQELERKLYKLQLLKERLRQHVPHHSAPAAAAPAGGKKEEDGGQGTGRQQYPPPLLALSDVAPAAPYLEATGKRKREENGGRDIARQRNPHRLSRCHGPREALEMWAASFGVFDDSV